MNGPIKQAKSKLWNPELQIYVVHIDWYIRTMHVQKYH